MKHPLSLAGAPSKRRRCRDRSARFACRRCGHRPGRSDLGVARQHYRVPDWFRDAKFGIWAHWGPQCQPEWGDWYARLLYMSGRPSWMKGETAYEHHLKHYGHPSRTGFLDVIGQWKAQNWRAEELINRYVKAGARYFFAMGVTTTISTISRASITIGTPLASGRSGTFSAGGSRWCGRRG